MKPFKMQNLVLSIISLLIFLLAIQPLSFSASNFDPTEFRGFNLLSKVLNDDWVHDDAQHWSFQFMQSNGFNFARIPMESHRLYTDTTYSKLRPEALAELDRIVRLGKLYNVHILLDLHSLPGMRVVDDAKEVEKWSTKAMKSKRVKMHTELFKTLAQRYRHHGPEVLSFNLINEPHNMTEAEYVDMIMPVYKGIRNIDKDRPIFLDGLNYGATRVQAGLPLTDPYVVLSPHMYQPFRVTHYKAEWSGPDAMNFPLPQYPTLQLNAFIYGSFHQELQAPLELIFKDQPLPVGSQVSITVDAVSGKTKLLLKGDEKILIEKQYESGPGKGEWKTVNYNKTYNIYQNIYQQTLNVTTNSQVHKLNLSAPEGDWFTISEIAISTPDLESLTLKVTDAPWGPAPAPGGIYILRTENKLIIDSANTKSMLNGDYLYQTYFKPWHTQSKSSRRPLVYTEFGVYHHTPHAVSLAVLEDQLKNFEKVDAGWALWNLSGAFGIFNSDRKDVNYNKVKYPGHALDEKMLNLLKKYLK